MQFLIRISILVSITILIFPAGSTPAGGVEKDTGKPPYTMGVFPWAAPSQLLKTNIPVLKAFSRILKRPVYFRTKSNPGEFQLELARKSYDLVYLPGHLYPLAHDKFGYQPLARFDKKSKAWIVVRRDSALTGIEGLKNKIFGMSHASSGSIPIHAALLDKGVIPGRNFEVREFKNNHICLQNLLIKKLAACSTTPFAVKLFQVRKNLGPSFKVLYEIPAENYHTYVIHPDFPEMERKALLENILSWPNTDAGRKILRKTKFPPFVEAKNEDFDGIRKLIRKIGK